MTPPSTLTSAELRSFVEVEYGRLVRAVAMACGDSVAAEDAVQEALAAAWRRTNEGLTIESLGKWIVTVAMNHVRKNARRDRAQHALWPRLVGQAAHIEPDHAEVIDLADALLELPTRQREAVVLHYYLGLSISEIASTLNVAGGTIKTALHRARAALATRVGLRDDEAVDD